MKAGRSYEGNGYEHYFDFGDAFMGISSCEKVITNAQGYTVVNNDIEKVTEKYVDLTYFLEHNMVDFNIFYRSRNTRKQESFMLKRKN